MTTLGPERLASQWAAKMRALQQPASVPHAPAHPPHAQKETVSEEPGLSRVQTRSRRKPELYPESPGLDYDRPVTRGDCEGGERPCPFVSCKFHLYLDVSDDGSIKLNFPNIEVWEMPESCILDLAARDGMTLEDVGTIMNITRERVRQLETRAERRLQRRASYGTGALAEIARDLDIGGKRRLPLVHDEDETDPTEEEEDDANDDDDDDAK